MISQLGLTEFQVKMHTDGRRHTLQRMQGHAFVLWAEQAVELRAARENYDSM